MFYNHEILTSRRHGVATIWLVATLGSKSSLKKINRKEISEVNIPQACKVIVSPEIPLALRLQSHLLYGVSRVYCQQCSYVLTDAQTAQQNMIQAFRKIANNVLDPEAGKTRPELLLIPDDPAFVPDLALGAPLLTPEPAELEFTQSTFFSSQHSGRTAQQSSSQSSYAAGAGIQIPASDSGVPGVGRLGSLAGDSSTAQRSRTTVQNILDEIYDDIPFSPMADFGFDAEGNLYDIDPQDSTVQNQDANTITRRVGSDTAAIERVIQEHEQARGVAEQVKSNGNALDDGNLPAIGESDGMLLDLESFPPGNQSETQQQEESLLDPDYQPQQEGVAAEEASETAEAQMTRRTRGRKVLQADSHTQIRTSTFNEWNRDYVQLMLDSAVQKEQKGSAALAKRNAEYWVWGSGLGDLRNTTIPSMLDSPLSMFLGSTLMARVTGIQNSIAGRRKRPRSETDVDQDDEAHQAARRRRSQSVGAAATQDDTDMADAPPVEDGLGLMADEDVELGREAPTPLAGDNAWHDTTSLMPWNLSVSRQSSTRATLPPAAQGSLGSGTASRGLHSRRTGRLTSASPLFDRGDDDGGLGQSAFAGGVDSSSVVDGGELGVGVDAGWGVAGGDFDVERGEFFGGSAGARAGLALLNSEGWNFLEFVRAACGQLDGDGEGEDGSAGVLFEMLLPPGENSRVVAAQGLMLVLVLGTEGVLRVVQGEAFGGIRLSPVE